MGIPYFFANYYFTLWTAFSSLHKFFTKSLQIRLFRDFLHCQSSVLQYQAPKASSFPHLSEQNQKYQYFLLFCPCVPIKEYCRLCLLPDSEDTLKARCNVILKQRDKAYKRLKEAQSTVSYTENKVRHYEDILSGILPDDTNPQNRTGSSKPQKH